MRKGSSHHPEKGKVELVGDISPPEPTPRKIGDKSPSTPNRRIGDKSPNRSLPRRTPIKVTKGKVRRITKIMSSDETLATIQELAENGASLSTIDATMMWPPNTMSKLIEKGKLSTAPKDPYRRFFMLFRKWAASARGQAELLLAKKSPDKWLDRNTSNKVIESEQDAQLALNAPSNPKIVAHSGVDLSTVQKALEILREQGADLNEAIDKGEFKLFITDQSTKEDDEE